MALPSSGQLSLEDIRAELGAGTSNVSLRSLSSTAGFAVPDAISEFYGYSNITYSNDYYYINDGTDDYIQGLWEGQTSLANNDWSISFWVKQDAPTAANQQLWDFNANGTINSGNTTNRLFLQYNASLNRFLVRLRTNSTNFDRQWALHDNNSVTGTGPLSSNTWTSSNPGNTNAIGWTMITVTYDASQTTATAALKIYWNGAELTSQAAATSGTRTNNTMGYLCLCASQHNVGSGNSNIFMDEWAFYNDLLTSTEVSALYNSGTIVSPHTINTTNLQEVVQFTSVTTSINTYLGNYSGTISGGTVEQYA